MAIAIIKQRNFSAQLPSDFVAMKILTRLSNNERLAYSEFGHPRTKYQDYFMICKDRIYFNGNYSKWRIVRVVQKINEKLFPIRYKMEYISTQEYLSKTINNY